MNMTREERLGKFNMANLKTDDNFINQYNNEKEVMQKQQTFEHQMLMEKQRKQEELWKDKIFKPHGFYVLFKPTDENPYLKKISGDGLILDNEGKFNNPDTGEQDFLEKGICYGVVLDVGPKVESVRPGDEFIYMAQRLIPVPFKGEGLCMLNEGQLLGVIGNVDELNYRFENGK